MKKQPVKFCSQRMTEAPLCMDYLHGKVPKGEAGVACLYEYSREWELLINAASERDNKARALRKAGQKRTYEQIAFSVVQYHWRPLPTWALLFLGCRSFPKKGWRTLTAAERSKIKNAYQRQRPSPLPMPDLWSLKVSGSLEKLASIASKAEPTVEDVPLGVKVKEMKIVPALIRVEGATHQGIFEIDFSKARKTLMGEFKAWLCLPAIRGLLQKHHMPKSGRTGKPFDRLRDLAAWRLFRESGYDWGAANELANALRKGPFKNQWKKGNRELGSEAAYYHRAKGRVVDYLSEITSEPRKQIQKALR